MQATESRIQFAICISGDEAGDLETWKVYRILPDEKGAKIGWLRVVDESGEDYLYPQTRFAIVDLPEGVREKLLATANI